MKTNQSIEEKNKTLVLDAFETLFNKRDYVAAERYWSPKYVQHSAPYSAWTGGTFRSDKKCTGDAEIRKSADPGEREISLILYTARYSGLGPRHTQLDRGGHRAA